MKFYNIDDGGPCCPEQFILYNESDDEFDLDDLYSKFLAQNGLDTSMPEEIFWDFEETIEGSTLNAFVLFLENFGFKKLSMIRWYNV